MWAVNDLVGSWWIHWESEHSLAAVRVMHRKEDAVRCCMNLKYGTNAEHSDEPVPKMILWLV